MAKPSERCVGMSTFNAGIMGRNNGMSDRRAKAMILAAGKGARMGSLSRHTPKPLVEVLGQSILRRAMQRLHAHGITRFAINVHHLAQKVRNDLSDEIDAGTALVSDETDMLLETGGGVKKALPLLAEDDFFVVNCDVVWRDEGETVLDKLRRVWDPSRMDVLLLMIPTEQAHGYDGVGDFFMDLSQSDEVGPLRFRDDASRSPFMFGAVQLVKAAMYDNTPDGAWSNREIFRRAAARGRLFGVVYKGDWFHVGTQAAIGEAEVFFTQNGGVL